MPRPNAPPYGERVLQLDPPCAGRDVWDLQIKLIAWGSGSDNDGIGAPYMPVRVSGTFDRATHNAVKRLQKKLAMPVTGVVNAATFRAIDGEAAQYAVMVHTMQCPCTLPDEIPIQCRCADHHTLGKCTGFGHAQYAGQFLLDAVQLPDGTSLASEKLDVYDKEEYPGVDKALIWAVRGLMRRAAIDRIKVVAGYRCWQDNYRHTDGRRWRHRRATFHFGKSVEFYHDGTCTEWGQNRNVLTACARCTAIRQAALDLCGFQPRWQEPDRVSVGGVADRARAGDENADAPQPAKPFAVHVSTVRRRDREKDEFVKKYADSVKPIYEGKASSYSYPIDMGDGLDWRDTPCLNYFENTESGPGGWFPFGPNRLWHPGIHLFQAASTPVYALADGEVVACRAGEAATQHPYGSRNFVLLRHKLKDNKTWYSLYMHLDATAIADTAAVAGTAVKWMRKISLLTKDHIEPKLPSPYFQPVNAGTPDSYLAGLLTAGRGVPPVGGLAPGEWVETMGGAAVTDPRTAGANPLDKVVPQNSTVIQTAAAGNPYVFLTLEGEELAKRVAANAGLTASINNHDPFALPSPIAVEAGELLGAVGQGPTDAAFGGHGDYLHLEVFSTDKLLTAAGYTDIDATDTSTLMDRKKIYGMLLPKNLISAEPAGVLLQTDLASPGAGVNRGACRSVILQTKSAWSVDWKVALNNSPSFTYMQDATKNTMGDSMNLYSWWNTVSAGAALPSPDSLYFYHPIVLMLQLASA